MAAQHGRALRAIFIAVNLALLPILALAYSMIVYPPNEYLGFTLQPDTLRLLEAAMITMAAAALVPLDISRPAAFLAQFLLVGALLPNLVYYAMTSQPRMPMYVMATSALLVVAVARSRWRIVLPVVRHGRFLGISIAIGATLGVLATLVGTYGLPTLNLNLYAVYDLRQEAADTGRVGYFSTWAAVIFNPLLLAWSLHRRSVLGAAVALVAQVALFLYTGAKAALFQPLLVILIYALYGVRWPAIALPVGLASFTAALLALAAVQPQIAEIVSDFSIRRVLFIPAFLNFGYFEFFDSHPKVALTSSLLGQLSDYPYGDMTTGQLIADFMVLGHGNATNGFLATGFMHFGIAGAIAFAGIVGLLLKCTDSFVDRVPPVLVVAAAIGPYRALLTESDVPTTLVTHGLLVSIVLLWLLQARPPGRCETWPSRPRQQA